MNEKNPNKNDQENSIQFEMKDQNIEKDDLNNIKIIPDIQIKNSNLEFHKRFARDEIIRSLLLQAPQPSSKETKGLINYAKQAQIEEIFDRILLISKYSNKELLHYLSIINSNLVYPLNSQNLIELKFAPQDKYLNLAISEYFGIIDQLYFKFSMPQKLELFYRFIYLFKNIMGLDKTIYNFFKKFLQEDFLDFFLFNQFYLNFPFLKEFIVDFGYIKNDIIKIGYFCPNIKDLAYNVVEFRFKTPLQPSYTDWVVQRWNVNSTYSISELFYIFDCSFFMENLGLKRFELLGDVLDYITKDVGCASDCWFCRKSKEYCKKISQKDLSSYFKESNDLSQNLDKIQRIKCEEYLKFKLESKKNFRTLINNFNSTSKLPENLDPKFLRISPLIDLKTLGKFLCKEKNLAYLQTFTKSFHFQKIDVLKSLRTFLSSFILVGESQIIGRVVDTFAEVYFAQNSNLQIAGTVNDNKDFTEDEIVEFYKSLVYSFIMLNTMLHNKVVDKKPAFEDYLNLLNIKEKYVLDKETIKSYYFSIKENEIKFPVSWADNYDLFLLSLDLEEDWKSEVLEIDFNRSINSDIYFDEPEHIDVKPTNSFFTQENKLLCQQCVLRAYKHLFIQSYKNYLFLEPEIFFKISKKLKCAEIFESYLDSCKQNVGKYLSAFKFYFGYFKIKNTSLIKDFFNNLFKTLKPKSSMLHDLKSLFSLSKSDLSNVDLKEKILSTVHSQFFSCISSLISLKFDSKLVCNNNSHKIFDFINADVFFKSDLHENKLNFVSDFFMHIIINNLEFLDDISYLNDAQIQTILNKTPNYAYNLNDVHKIQYLKAVTEYNDEHFEVFKSINLINQDYFEVLCYLQDKYIKIEDIIEIKLVVSKDGLAHFEFDECCKELLAVPKNILRLFTTSNSILNYNRILSIHEKNNCPLENSLFDNFNLVVYLLYKCNLSDNELIDYSIQIMKCLSESLVFYLKLLLFISPCFSQIPEKIIKETSNILVKRLKQYKNTGIACCDEFNSKKEIENGVKIDTSNYISNSLKRLVELNFIEAEILEDLERNEKPVVVEL